MAATAPAVTAALALQILAERFGLSGELMPLGSERDQNFSVVTAGGERFVLKISNPAESAAVLDFQAQALLHVAQQAPDLPVPHIVPAKDGRPLVRIETPAGPCMVRVVSYLAGVPVSDVPWTSALRRNLGRTLARLGVALRGYFHPSAQHPLLWDVGRAAAVASLAVHVEDPARRALVQGVFERHRRQGLARLGNLRAQVIHNDCNPDNVLVSVSDRECVSGIIDFGDMVHAPLVNDVAVLAAYQVVGDQRPVEAACDLVGAYHAANALEAAELDILPDLVALRLAMSVCIGAWRGKQHPDNVAYILGEHEDYWQTLDEWTALDTRDIASAFRAGMRRCGSGRSTGRCGRAFPACAPCGRARPGSPALVRRAAARRAGRGSLAV